MCQSDARLLSTNEEEKRLESFLTERTEIGILSWYPCFKVEVVAEVFGFATNENCYKISVQPGS